MKDSRTAKTSIIFCANVISIITLFIYASAGGFESAAVQTCIEAWPGETAVSIRMMLTLPALVQSVFMLVTGPFFGKKISYRFAGIAGEQRVEAAGHRGADIGILQSPEGQMFQVAVIKEILLLLELVIPFVHPFRQAA